MVSLVYCEQSFVVSASTTEVLKSSSLEELNKLSLETQEYVNSINTAAKGKQAPLLIDCPWLYSNITNKK